MGGKGRRRQAARRIHTTATAAQACQMSTHRKGYWLVSITNSATPADQMSAFCGSVERAGAAAIGNKTGQSGARCWRQPHSTLRWRDGSGNT